MGEGGDGDGRRQGRLPTLHLRLDYNGLYLIRVLIMNFGLLAKPAYLNLVKSSLVLLHSPFWLFFSTE